MHLSHWPGLLDIGLDIDWMEWGVSIGLADNRQYAFLVSIACKGVRIISIEW